MTRHLFIEKNIIRKLIFNADIHCSLRNIRILFKVKNALIGQHLPVSCGRIEQFIVFKRLHKICHGVNSVINLVKKIRKTFYRNRCKLVIGIKVHDILALSHFQAAVSCGGNAGVFDSFVCKIAV